MKSILRELYNGNIIPWERRNPDPAQHRELHRQIEDAEGYLMGRLSPDDCRRLEALCGLYTELAAAGEEQLFAYAFTLGLRLALETMQEEKGLFNS